MRSCAQAITVFLLVGATGCVTHREVVVQGAPQASVRRVPPGHARKAGRVPPGYAKRAVTVDQAVVVTREVLTQHGYEVVRSESAGGARIVYYRVGNRGRGNGRGPVEKILIRPTSERVIFEAAPPRVQIDINARLGL